MLDLMKKCCALLALSVALSAATPDGLASTQRGRRRTKARVVKRAPAVAAAATPKRIMKTLLTGMWGGQGVGLRVNGGVAEIEFDCAHGAIDGRIELDSEGRFDVTGTFVPEGGPVSFPVNGVARENSFTARYQGRVEGQQLTLNVTVKETGAVFDAMTLTHGRGPSLVKCY